jgi:hypothetical protein
LVLACCYHFVDLIDLSLIPFNLRLVVVASILEEDTGREHVIVALDQTVRLDVAQIIKSSLELLALHFEVLRGIFFSP